MSSPRATVIIPCFNDGELAEQAVASIRENERVEIIVVDDGSSDPATEAAMERLARRGVTLHRQPNGGQHVARTSALHLASTRYILPLDADDLLCEGVIGPMCDLLDARPDLDFCVGDYERFGAGSGLWRAPEWSAWRATYANFWSPTALFRREVLIDIGGWFPPKGYEDWGLYMALAARDSRAAHIGRVIYRRRLHGPREQTAARRLHRSHYRTFMTRHPELFADRPRLARKAGASLLLRIAYPLVLGGRPLMPIWLESRLLPLWARLAAWRGRSTQVAR